MPRSTLIGSANLLVLPDIDAANISYNLLKAVAGGNISVGPVPARCCETRPKRDVPPDRQRPAHFGRKRLPSHEASATDFASQQAMAMDQIPSRRHNQHAKQGCSHHASDHRRRDACHDL